jgi:hypothetical protein
MGLVAGLALASAAAASDPPVAAAPVADGSPATPAVDGARAGQSRAMGGMGGLSCEKPPRKLHYDDAKQAKWIAQAREDGYVVRAVAHACGYGFLYQDRPLTPQAKAARSYTERQREQEMRKYGIDPEPKIAFSGGDLLLLVEDDAAPDVRRDGSYLRALYPRGWMSRGYVSRGNVQLLEAMED